MSRIASLAAALVSSTLLLSALPAAAQGAGYYNATPVVAPTKVSMITGDTMWKCKDGVCSARKSASRDVIVCQQVVQRVGVLSTFSANGAVFDAANLAKCNARAK